MKTLSYLTGNILFDGSIDIPQTATIKITIDDVTIANSDERAYEKKIEFDAQALSVFKYIPFELKDFEHDPARQYQLSAHVDVASTGTLDEGDYVTNTAYPIVTALEEINLHLTKVVPK
jgi:uncharacterized lipoprotein YbaY